MILFPHLLLVVTICRCFVLLLRRWAIKKYLTKKRGMSGKEVDKQLGIDSSFDYITADPALFRVK
jgi:hypothetical protein